MPNGWRRIDWEARRARSQAEAARAEEGKQRGLAEQRRAESDESRRSLESTLADMYTAQGLMAAERNQGAQAVLWFASASRVAPSDVGRLRYNTTRARAWSRTIAQPVAAFHFGTDLPSHTDGDPRAHYAPRLQNLAFHPREPHLLAVSSSLECIIWDIMRDEAIPIPGERPLRPARPGARTGSGSQSAGNPAKSRYTNTPDGIVSLASNIAGRFRGHLQQGRQVSALASEIVRVWDCEESRFVTPYWCIRNRWSW